MEIYFLRHGRSVSREHWAGSDEERPLSEEGKAAMAHEAATFARLGLRPDLIISSPLRRARETAEIAAIGLGEVGRSIVDGRLREGFGVKQLRQILRETGHAKRLLLVGHEPDFSATIRKLTGARAVCSKGSLARVDVGGGGATDGQLVWLLQAAELTGEALASSEGTARVKPGSSQPGEQAARVMAPSGEKVPLLDATPTGEARGETRKAA